MKVNVIARSDEHTEPKMEGSCGNSEVVRWNETPFAAQARKEVGPAFGDLGTKIDDRNPGDQGSDLRPATGRARRIRGEAGANKKFRIDYRGEHDRLIAQGRDGLPSA